MLTTSFDSSRFTVGLQGNVIMLQNRKKTFDDGKILRSFVSAPLRTPSSGYSGLQYALFSYGTFNAHQ